MKLSGNVDNEAEGSILLTFWITVRVEIAICGKMSCMVEGCALRMLEKKIQNRYYDV